jgi:myo-inositol-1-phosphate synthase
LNGTNTISTYNVCEDSLLAVPLMYDMIVLADLFSRMEIDGEKMGPILSYLSFYSLKTKNPRCFKPGVLGFDVVTM